MASINNIFRADGLIEASPKIKYNREQLLQKDVADELNTYLNFGIFPVFADTKKPEYDLSDPNYKRTADSEIGGTPGVRSIFNRAGAVLLGSDKGEYNVDITSGDNKGAHAWRISNNVPLMDSPLARQRMRKAGGCSIRELVDASSKGLMGQETYSYADFMYCKHLGKVSNNYMITLRRFPLPVDDFIGSIGEIYDDKNRFVTEKAASIGCMVTWLGVSGNEMNSILKYNYKMPFREQTAEREQAMDADQNTSILNGMFSIFDKEYRENYQKGYGGEAANAAFEAFGIRGMGRPPYSGFKQFEDRNKVYGPVDSIRSTYIRDDKGLTFSHSFSLVFEYELKSYNGINGRQAMLDLISNILNVTYTTGTFFGGGYKGFGMHQSNIFANLRIFKTTGGFTNFIDDFSKDLADLGKSKGKELGFIDASGNIDIKKGLKGVLQSLNSLGGMIMSGMLNKLGRPQKMMHNSFLSPAPIGFWHVTIGNPKHPIMSIGNMVITDCSIEHTGPLGLDDFPTGLKVTVTLDRGKPRDLREIEKLYMQGNDRIYTSMGDHVFDMYKNSKLYKDKRNSQGGKLPVDYEPKTQIATANIESSEPTVTVQDYQSIQSSMKKYFGTDDTYAIFVPATEQEYGAGNKPSNDNK